MLLQQTPGRAKIKGTPCKARISRHEDTLYIAVTVPIKKAAELRRGKARGRDDGVEVCLVDPKGAAPSHSLVLHGFCGGASESVTDGGASLEAAKHLGQAVHYAATIHKDSWTAEWAIPLEAADAGLATGTKLAFNLCVHRSQTNEWILWTGTLGTAWRLENAGTLVLE